MNRMTREIVSLDSGCEHKNDNRIQCRRTVMITNAHIPLVRRESGTTHGVGQTYGDAHDRKNITVGSNILQGSKKGPRSVMARGRRKGTH